VYNPDDLSPYRPSSRFDYLRPAEKPAASLTAPSPAAVMTALRARFRHNLTLALEAENLAVSRLAALPPGHSSRRLLDERDASRRKISRARKNLLALDANGNQGRKLVARFSLAENWAQLHAAYLAENPGASALV